MTEPGTPERESVDDGLTQDNLPRSGKRGRVEDTDVRTRQVKMIMGAGPQVVVNFAPVHFANSSLADDGECDGSIEVLMAGFGAKQSDLFQSVADVPARLGRCGGQPQPQGAVG